jgi:hypothetical protein
MRWEVEPVSVSTVAQTKSVVASIFNLKPYSHFPYEPVIDSATYLASAFLLWMVRGEYNVSDPEKQTESPWIQFKSMTVEGVQYLSSSFFGALVLLKAMAALAYGACDVLNVVLSELGDTGDRNRKVGILFSVVGIGCLLGPLIAEPYVDVERPTTVQLSCVIAFGISALGYFGWIIESPFWCLSLVALFRSAGSSIIWINSTLLLQKFSAPKMLGRVLAADYALALLAEALSAYLCGFLIDQAGLSAYQVSFVLAALTTLLTVIWSWYHISGHGAGKYKSEILSPQKRRDTDEPSSSESSSLLPSNPGM